MAGRTNESGILYWDPANRRDCYVTATVSFDEGIMAAFSLIEGERFRIAYILDPLGIPCAVVTEDESAMVLLKLGMPLRSEVELPPGAVEELAQDALRYNYIRSRGGWVTDGPVEATPMVASTWIISRTQVNGIPCMWPGLQVTLQVAPYDHPSDPSPQWREVNAGKFRTVWNECTRGVFARPFEEES